MTTETSSPAQDPAVPKVSFGKEHRHSAQACMDAAAARGAYRAVALKWLMWNHGKTSQEAVEELDRRPFTELAAEVADVAAFVVEQCGGH
jgi:hypothetical protein